MEGGSRRHSPVNSSCSVCARSPTVLCSSGAIHSPGPLSDEHYRVSVKVEPNGAAGSYLNSSVRAGDVLDVSEPRGSFTLQPGDGPVVLLSAGIGATPVLAMLHALAASASAREVWWLHGARNGKSHSFATEVRQLLGTLARGRSRIWYSRPDADDRVGQDYDATGRLGMKVSQDLRVPQDGDFYICGPSSFLGDLMMGLTAWGVPADRIHSEVFSGGPSLMPGVVSSPVRAPHQPAGTPGAGPLVSFARSGITVRWRRRRTRAFSSWRKHVTCPSGGRAAPASATTARAD